MSNDRTSQLIGRLREAAEWLAEDIPEGTPEIEHLEGDVRLDELDLYCVWLMRQAADALSDPNPILAARVEELEAERDALIEESATLTRALTGLTCGGSEFFIRKGDRYTADIRACVDWVRRRDQQSAQRALDAMRRAKEAEAARQSAEARVEALEKALEEIADLCPATQEVCLASTMGQIAIAALSSQGAEDGK